MATQAIDQAPVADDAGIEAPATGASKRNVIIFAVSGLVAGLAVGLFAIGPILNKHRTPVPPKKASTEAVSSAVNHAVENLVLNPAGSGGARFLMVTATFQVKDAGVEQLMKEHDAEVRDRVLGVLGKKSVDELGDMARRDQIKKEVLDGVAPLFPKGSILKLFFAQFVIQ